MDCPAHLSSYLDAKLLEGDNRILQPALTLCRAAGLCLLQDLPCTHGFSQAGGTPRELILLLQVPRLGDASPKHPTYYLDVESILHPAGPLAFSACSYYNACNKAEQFFLFPTRRSAHLLQCFWHLVCFPGHSMPPLSEQMNNYWECSEPNS